MTFYKKMFNNDANFVKMFSDMVIKFSLERFIYLFQGKFTFSLKKFKLVQSQYCAFKQLSYQTQSL